MRLPLAIWSAPFVALVPVACAAAEPAAVTDAGASAVALSDGTWTLRVDRAWNGAHEPVFPGGSLAESDYAPVTDGPVYAVTVSADAGVVAIVGDGGPVRRGARADAGAEIAFELSEGTFAGGRFVVRGDDRRLDAELTTYGSGRPIVASERGALSPAP